jgi:hypothetical protein
MAYKQDAKLVLEEQLFILTTAMKRHLKNGRFRQAQLEYRQHY